MPNFDAAIPVLNNPDLAPPPMPPQNFQLISQTASTAKFKWDGIEISDLSGYKIYYDTDESGYPYKKSIDLGNVTETTLTDLTPGEKYYVAVESYDNGNEGGLILPERGSRIGKSWYSNEVLLIMNNTPVIASISENDIKQIAQDKMNDLNTDNIESAKKMVAGTARSMGIKVEK